VTGNDKFWVLLEKYRNNTCTADELKWMEDYLDQLGKAEDGYIFSGEAEKKQTRETIRQNVFATINEERGATIKKFTWKRFYTYAAAACVLAVVSTIYFLSPKDKMINIASAAGQVMKHQLPDGSVALLNDSSVISYSSNDFKANRKINLVRGEVFFEVKKDPAHPFIVTSNEINTTVKGTSFSVKLLQQSGNVKVSVVTGRVAVSHASDTLDVLYPNQRLKYDHLSGKAIKDSIADAEANGWVNGEILMQNASLEEIAQWFESAFRVHVINYKHTNTGEYYLRINKNISLEEAIKILNLLGKKDKIKFSLQKQTVTIQ
jgi:transmembrane sensor